MKLFVVSISTKIRILKSLVVRNTYGFTLNSDKFGTCYKNPNSENTSASCTQTDIGLSPKKNL